MAWAMSSPAPPLIQMAGSSSDPCATTNSVRGKSIPARRQAAEMAPSINPLKASSQTVPMPNVRPSPQVRSETLMLLTAIWLLAAGAVRVSDSVQSRFASMAARIGGLTKKFSSTGFCAVRKNPRIALAQKRSRGQQDRAGCLAHPHRPGLLPELRPAS